MTLRLPGAQGQLCQERTVTQPTGIVPGYSYRLSADDSYCLIGTSHLDSASHCFLQGRHCLSGQSFPEDAEPYGSGTSPVLRLGLLRMRSIQFWLKQRVLAVAWRHGHHRSKVTRAGVSALTHWRHPLWLKRGVTLDTVQRRKVVKTDASNKGWGALCEGKPTYGLWSKEESTLHINCLEMLAVCQACDILLAFLSS